MYFQSASIRLKVKNILCSTPLWLYATALVLTLPSIAHADTPPTVTFAGLQTTLTTALESGGVAADKAGDIFIANLSGSKLIKLPADGGAQIVMDNTIQATGVALDSAGKLYVTAYNLDRLLVYTPESAAAPTSLGSGFQESNDISIDVHGNVYVTDTQNNQVVELPAGDGAQTVVGSGLSVPNATAVDSAGNVYVADYENQCPVESPVGGGSPIDVASGITPGGVTVDTANNVFYQDARTQKLYDGPSSGRRRTIAGALQGYGGVSNVSTDTAGNLYVSHGGDGSGAAVKIQLGAMDLGKVNVCFASAAAPSPCTDGITLDLKTDAVSSGFTSLAAQVLTQGGTNLDYTSTSTTCEGAFPSSGTCSVTIQFAPLAPGTHLGAVDILGATTASPIPSSQANVYLHDIGTAPQGASNAAPISTLPIALLNKNFINGLTVAASEDLYLVDRGNCVLQKYSAAC